MIDQLTLADLLRVLAWAFFGSLPLFLAYGLAMKDESKNKDEGLQALFLWLTLASQIGFGVAAFMAGGK